MLSTSLVQSFNLKHLVLPFMVDASVLLYKDQMCGHHSPAAYPYETWFIPNRQLHRTQSKFQAGIHKANVYLVVIHTTMFIAQSPWSMATPGMFKPSMQKGSWESVLECLIGQVMESW